MSEQQKNTLQLTNQFDQFTPALIYCLLSIFLILVLWVQLETPILTISNQSIYAFLVIAFLSVGSGFSILFSYQYREGKRNQKTIEKIFNPNAFELRGANTLLFYSQFHQFVIKEDRDYYFLEREIQKKKIAYVILGSSLAFLLILAYDNMSENPFKILVVFRIVGVVFVSGLIFTWMIKDIRSLFDQKNIHLKLDALAFSSLVEKKRITLKSSLKNDEQQKLYEFLDLANFLQKYYQNFTTKFKKKLSYGIINLVFGILLYFYPGTDLLFKNIGLGIVLLGVIFIGRTFAQYNTSKILMHFTDLTLQSTLFVF